MKIEIADLNSPSSLRLTAVPNLEGDFANRLVTLCDGRPGLRSALITEVHQPGKDAFRRVPDQNSHSEERGHQNESSPTLNSKHETQNSFPVLDFISSSDHLDRYDEVITPSGWRLENYQRNPVFQNAHKYGDIIFTLGKALITEVRAIGGRSVLFQRIEFATDVNPMAKIAYGLYQGKFLNAVSVGFIPLRWQNADGAEQHCASPSPACQAVASERRLGGEGRGEGEVSSTVNFKLKTQNSLPFRRKYLEQELLEVSAVGIPANPEALQLGLKAGAIEKSDLREMLDMLERACQAESRFPSPPASQSLRRAGWPSPQGEISPKNSRTEPLNPRSNNGPLTPALSPSISPSFPFPPAAPNTHARASGVRSNEAQLGQQHATHSVLLQLARAVRETLKR